MGNMRFDPQTLAARTGQPIQLTLSNTGQFVHDFAMNDGSRSRSQLSVTLAERPPTGPGQ